VFGDRVFRKIFGPKRDEVTEGLKIQGREELHTSYSSQNCIIRVHLIE
jgi:hypothetical protein